MIIKRTSRTLGAIAASALAFALPLASHAQDRSGSPSTRGQLSKLSAEWWQWALSIPSSVNPLQDESGDYCMVGLRGDVWFLAGTFTATEEETTRTCTVSEKAELFFPIANSFFVAIDCKGSPSGETIEEARAKAATGLEGTEIVKVELDGQPISNVPRVQSKVFWVALPEDNLFDQFCDDTTPAGVYSPAVDDGYYVRLKPLPVGEHTLQFETTGTISQSITYMLNVEPVRLR